MGDSLGKRSNSVKLKLTFGFTGPSLNVKWWQGIRDFPNLVTYKGKKWEFVVYNTDDSNQVDYICMFSEVGSFDPNYYSTTYSDIEVMFGTSWGSQCECGAQYSSFPWDHMRFCNKWSKW